MNFRYTNKIFKKKMMNFSLIMKSESLLKERLQKEDCRAGVVITDLTNKYVSLETLLMVINRFYKKSNLWIINLANDIPVDQPNDDQQI